MSEPQSPTPPSPEASTSAPSPQPQAASPAAPPAKEPSRWTSLILAVAVVTVGGFLLGRAGNNPPPPPPAPVINVMPGRNVPMLATNRIPPSQLLQRLRDARLKPVTASLPSSGAGLQSPRALLKPDPNQEANALQSKANAVGFIGNSVRPQIQSCLGKVATQPATATVAFTLHRDPTAGGTLHDVSITESNFNDSQVRQCVVDAVSSKQLPELKGTGELTGAESFSSAAH